MHKNKTLVIGASENPQRYSNIAMRMLKEIDKPTVGIGRKEGEAHDSKIIKGRPELDDIDTVTLYVSHKYQDEYINYILDEIRPQRIIFNPGTENEDFYKRATDMGIEAIEACTLVMIRTGVY
ncbi:MAG: CoA-binding protein [Saprospiraceae bacterium]